MPVRIYLPAKQSKYRAKPIVVDNVRFASQKEGRRYGELKLLQKAGVILGALSLQTPFAISINGVLICHYRADFTYETKDGLVVEDVKGMRTKEYKLKKKLMWACHGIVIKEV